MERTYIVNAADGETVKIQGFVENLRDSKSMAFLVIKDITGRMQVTVEKESAPQLADVLTTITPDSVVSITGKVVARLF